MSANKSQPRTSQRKRLETTTRFEAADAFLRHEQAIEFDKLKTHSESQMGKRKRLSQAQASSTPTAPKGDDKKSEEKEVAPLVNDIVRLARKSEIPIQKKTRLIQAAFSDKIPELSNHPQQNVCLFLHSIFPLIIVLHNNILSLSILIFTFTHTNILMDKFNISH